MNNQNVFPAIKKDIMLSDYCSMKTGGRAQNAYFPTSEEQLVHLIRELKANGEKYLIYGNASNVLMPDEGTDCAVIFTTGIKELYLKNEHTIYSSCGTPLTSLSNFAAKNSLTGLEFAYGIPGSVGGAVFMNAGAYGGEMKNAISFVKYLDTVSFEINNIECSQCGFSYRESIFSKDLTKIILGAYFVLEKGNSSCISETCRELMQKRKEKQPLEYPSCGSAFKRPENNFAGKLIEDAGLKGLSLGGASVSEKHAGFIINKNGATSKDVAELMEKVKNEVYAKFGVLLEPEIRLLQEYRQ